MVAVALTSEQSKGVKTSIVVIMLVLLLFVLILIAGQPIVYLGDEPPSIAYAVAIYAPVLAICFLVYRRLY